MTSTLELKELFTYSGGNDLYKLEHKEFKNNDLSMSEVLELKELFTYYPRDSWEDEMDFDCDNSFAQSEFDEGDIEEEQYALAGSYCCCGRCMDCLGMTMRDFI